MNKLDEANKEVAIYRSNEGDISFQVNVFEETVWLSQKQMAELFDTSADNVSLHLKNIYSNQELREFSTTEDFSVVQFEGKRSVKRKTKLYNLDAIIAVGYRVNSKRATQFRQWATKVLRQYLINGYAVNEVRVKEIKSSINDLVSSQKILKEDVARIEKLLVNLIERPIVIHSNNQLKIGNNELEQKLVSLLDQIIKKLKKDENPLKNRVEELKQEITELPSNNKAQKRIVNFFKEIGDNNSDIHKAIKGAGIAKNIISELIKIGERLRELF